MTPLRDHPAVAAILPEGSRRRAAAAALARRARSKSAQSSKRKPSPLIQREDRQLTKAWAHRDPEMLDIYLVSGFQDPRLNVQSILARHLLVRALFGSKFDELMNEELTFAVEINEAVRLRAKELGVTLSASLRPEGQAEVQRVMSEFETRASAYVDKWRWMLAGKKARHLKVLELACGSANDYRALAQYGIAPFLDYTGIDLNVNNIANAKRRFPDVDFRVGSILSLPMADRSFDYVLAFDIFEHLSLPAMQEALDEAVRVSRRGMYIAFFRMADVPDHIDEPRGDYHFNTLSAPRVREYFEKHYPSVDLVHIPTLLHDRFDYKHSYNKRAYSLIAERRHGLHLRHG
jgi:ubiquinone/menaquinone biosynthesis C-methylase UbiE